MEEPADRELEAILKLVKLTQDGALQWQSAKPWGDLKETDTTKYQNVMFCDFENKRLRIFVEKKRIDPPAGLDSITMSAFDSILNRNRTYPYWDESVVLEISNIEGHSLWRFRYKPAIQDLFNAVRYQVAGVKDFLDSVLSIPPKM
jgi:hypothetical protein